MIHKQLVDGELLIDFARSNLLFHDPSMPSNILPGISPIASRVSDSLEAQAVAEKFPRICLDKVDILQFDTAGRNPA